MPFVKGGVNGKAIRFNFHKKRHRQMRPDGYTKQYTKAKRHKQQGPPGKGLGSPREQLLRIEENTEGLNETEIRQMWAFEVDCWDTYALNLEKEVGQSRDELEQAFLQLEASEAFVREHHTPETRTARKPISQLHVDNQYRKLKKLREEVSSLEAKNLLPEFAINLNEDMLLEESDRGPKETMVNEIESNPTYKIDRLIQVLILFYIPYIFWYICIFLFIRSWTPEGCPSTLYKT